MNRPPAYLGYEDDLVKLIEDLRDRIVYLTHFARGYTEGCRGSS